MFIRTNCAHAFGWHEQAIIARRSERDRRLSFILRPLSSDTLCGGVAGRNEKDSAIGLGDRIESGRIGTVAIWRRLMLDVQAHIEYPHVVAGLGIGHCVLDLVEELRQPIGIVARKGKGHGQMPSGFAGKIEIV